MELTLRRAELVMVELPLRTPWRTSAGTIDRKPVLLVHVLTSAGEGWAECAAMPAPDYTGEHVDGALDVLRNWLIPERLASGPMEPGMTPLPTSVRGHQMARAALDEALLDARLRAEGRSLAQFLGVTATRVPAGVALGLPPSAANGDRSAIASETRAAVSRAVDEGYRRVRLKIDRGIEADLIAAARVVAPEFELMADGNGAYTSADVNLLTALDAHHLACIEQPLASTDLLGHRDLAKRIATSIALDEPLDSPDAVAIALELSACSAVNLKRARVGGMANAVAAHDLCRARRADLWIGGMLESAVGRAANIALAALPGCTLIADLSPSTRLFSDDLAAPFEIHDGMVSVPDAPGVSPWPEQSRLEALGAVTITVD
ncbi:MAG: o-succinylbenzoate synthase [Acidimicrobiia bacterium]